MAVFVKWLWGIWKKREDGWWRVWQWRFTLRDVGREGRWRGETIGRWKQRIGVKSRTSDGVEDGGRLLG